MLFRILGSLEVRTREGWCGIGAPKWRALLGALLLRPGQVVSTERLIDELWGDNPPPGARKLVSGYVLRLRRMIDDPDGRVLVTRSPGYQLLVARCDLDAGLFEDLLAARGKALAREDAGHAAGLLAEALALWRGAALADVPQGPLVSAEADRLEELRLTALELRIEADLACGCDTGVIAELRRLTAEHPLRERLWGELMRALHGSGRPAEALEVYAHAREVIAQELGADPGPDLQQLHQRILTGEPSPTAESSPGEGDFTVADAAGPVVPRQLPAAVRDFTGRAGELGKLTGLLHSAGTVVIAAVSGTAGVGKTALAVHWAHRVVGRFSDGQLYVNLRGFEPSGMPMTPAEAIRGFLDAFHVPAERIPVGLDAQAALYRSLLAGKRMLVVLDNARDTAQVRSLLPGSPGCLVVVTSRAQLTGLAAAEGAELITLDLLSEAEACQLLADRVGADRVAAQPQAAAVLAGLCARLPLALAVAAARAASRPGFSLAVAAAELRDARRRLDVLDTGDPATGVRAVFSWSYQQLSVPAGWMFRLLGVHPGPDISAPAAASLAGFTRDQARQALGELAGANLLAEHAPGRFAFHDLLRAYAADQARAEDNEAESRSAVHRMLDHYLYTGHAAALLLDPHRVPLTVAPLQPGVTPEELADHVQALAWIEAEHAVLLAAVSQAVGAGFDTHGWQIPWTLMDFFHRRGHARDWVVVQETALAAAVRLGDQEGEAHAYRFLGRAQSLLGRHDEALSHLRRALDLHQQLGDQIGQGKAHHGLALVLDFQERYGEALPHARHALELYRAAGHRAGQADALNAVGWIHALLGDYRQALAYCQQALSLHLELGRRQGEAFTWDSLGYAHHHLGHHLQAITCYRRAVDLYRELGNRYEQPATLIRLGDTHRAAGDPKAARAAWRQALAILDDLHHPNAAQVHARLCGLGGARSWAVPVHGRCLFIGGSRSWAVPVHGDTAPERQARLKYR